METGNRSRAREGVEAKEQGERNRGKSQKPTVCGQSGQEDSCGVHVEIGRREEEEGEASACMSGTARGGTGVETEETVWSSDERRDRERAEGGQERE